MDDWQSRLQLPEDAGPFQATVVMYGLSPQSGEVNGGVVKVFVSPFGRRLEIPINNEVRLILKEEGHFRTYRLDTASRTAHVIEDAEPKTAHPQKSRLVMRSTERHRGFWCVVEQTRDSDHSGTVSEHQTWTISAGPAKGWTLRGIIKMHPSSGEIVYYVVGDTLELEFKTLPHDLFVIPRDYRVIKAGSGE